SPVDPEQVGDPIQHVGVVRECALSASVLGELMAAVPVQSKQRQLLIILEMPLLEQRGDYSRQVLAGLLGIEARRVLHSVGRLLQTGSSPLYGTFSPAARNRDSHPAAPLGEGCLPS